MDSQTRELLDATQTASEVLYKAETVFPFNLFPDTVTVDREKITVANRFFFRVAKINSTQIQDIQSIEANIGPFFGSIHITSKFFVNNPRTIKFLTRGDALAIQRLVQGFMIAKEKDIDCSEVDKDKLVLMLTNIGQGATD